MGGAPGQYAVLTEILANAAQRGQRTAFVHGSESVDHAGFARRWRALAALLEEKGLCPGDRVAIALPKSINAVAAMAATLAAGGVYVPVDQHQPALRARYVVENSGAATLVTDRRFLAELGLASGDGALRTILLVDDLHQPTRAAPSLVERSPDDLAFILYTSGSTGNPKGVQITHRNLLTFINWAIGELEIGPGDVFSSHAAFTFDLSTFDLYAALAVGGSVVLIKEDDMKTPAALGALIAAHRISVWYSVPSILQLMLATGSFAQHDCSSLRYVLFAGEVFPLKHVLQLAEALPAAQLYNLYGPTETNVCTYYRLGPADRARTSPLPIGRPLPGLVARVVNETGGDVEPGIIGELVIEGPCVTPGYWKLTDHRNANNHGRRIHATGDLVSEQGELLVYHGRIDSMIKLRGHRVELGEIESVLSRHPAIEHVAVIPAEVSGETRLVACFSPVRGEPAPSLIALKAYCAQHLPVYMIPHLLRPLDALAANANGKIDRKRLAELVQEELRDIGAARGDPASPREAPARSAADTK